MKINHRTTLPVALTIKDLKMGQAYKVVHKKDTTTDYVVGTDIMRDDADIKAVSIADGCFYTSTTPSDCYDFFHLPNAEFTPE